MTHLSAELGTLYPVTLANVESARELLADVVRVTPWSPAGRCAERAAARCT